MILLNEIRYGNVFQWAATKDLLVFDVDCFTVTMSGIAHLERIEGIPLTPDVLEKCGFVRKNYDDNRHEWFYVDDFWLQLDWHHRDYLTYFPGWPEVDCSGYTTIVKHLHQLQNLYYALTGMELSINMAQPLISHSKHKP